MKMMMIGLGKKDGAALYHRAILDHGFPNIVRSVAPQVVRHANILCGVAIVENGLDETALVEAILPEDFESKERHLLESARRWMPSLPFAQIDVLLVDQIGKNISGTGMDTNVIGRKHSEPQIGPDIRRIIVRGLTKETNGNATGVGFAEFCLSNVVNEMDQQATFLNCLTALDVGAAKIPIHFKNDRDAISAALQTLGLTHPNEAKLVWIHDTGHLAQFWCSESYSPEIDGDPKLNKESGPIPLPFDDVGMLINS